MERKIDEAAVWRRVTAASGTTTETGKEKEPPAAPPFEQALLATLVSGMTLASAYGALGRSGRRLHNEFAQGQRAENRLLKSLYFLKTGYSPRLPENTLHRDPKEAYVARLRWLLDTQGKQQEALEALSGQASGKTAKILTELTQKAAQRWEALLTELANQLEKT